MQRSLNGPELCTCQGHEKRAIQHSAVLVRRGIPPDVAVIGAGGVPATVHGVDAELAFEAARMYSPTKPCGLSLALAVRENPGDWVWLETSCPIGVAVEPFGP